MICRGANQSVLAAACCCAPHLSGSRAVEASGTPPASAAAAAAAADNAAAGGGGGKGGGKGGGGGRTHDVVITAGGKMGVAWKQMVVNMDSTRQAQNAAAGSPAAGRSGRQHYPVVKSVQPGSVGAKAGIQPFEVLIGLNGQHAAAVDISYEQAIGMLRTTRPLKLSFMEEKAALKATVTFVKPGPLGLVLEPISGNPVSALHYAALQCSPSPLLLSDRS
eukprot:COSAG06_NODE_533_length_14542_cov_17.021325_6_plen_220_part_00